MATQTANEPGSSLLGILLSQYAPQLAAGNVDIAQAQQQLNLDPQLFGLSQGYAQQQYGNQQAQFGLSQQGLGLQGQQLGLQQRGLGLEQGLLGTQQGIAGQQYGLQQQGLNEQLAQLQYNYPLQVQQQQSQGAASGALNTQGQGQALGTLAAYNGPGGWNQQDIQRSMQQASLSNQLQQAGFGYQGGQLGIAQQGLGINQAQLGLQQQGLGLEQQLAQQGYGYQQAVSGIQGALGQGQDLANLANQIAGQAGIVTGAGQQLGVLQGMPLQAQVAQPNSGN